jgi:hypothetical protein
MSQVHVGMGTGYKLAALVQPAPTSWVWWVPITNPLLTKQKYIRALPSVAVTQAGVFANLWNKIGTILKIFERLDYLRSRWVLCQL